MTTASKSGWTRLPLGEPEAHTPLGAMRSATDTIDRIGHTIREHERPHRAPGRRGG